MATVADVVTHALKQARVIAPGVTPSADEAADGLTCFQAMLDQWATSGLFGRLTDTYQTDDYTAAEGERVIAPTAITVTFPTSLDDEAEGGTRSPYDLSLIETVLNGTRTVKLYDRTAWVDLLGLALADDAPLAARGLAGLSACLAQTYCEMFGAQLLPYTQRLAQHFLASLSLKFGSVRPKEAACYY